MPVTPYSVTCTCDQAKEAVSTASSSRMPVLLTVPLRVIAPPSRDTTVPLPRSRKVDSLSAGLPLRMLSLRRMSGPPEGYRQQAEQGMTGRPADATVWHSGPTLAPGPAWQGRHGRLERPGWWAACAVGAGSRGWCERRDSNPHGGYPLEPKSSASRSEEHTSELQSRE